MSYLLTLIKQREPSGCCFPMIWWDNTCANTLKRMKVYVNWSQHSSLSPSLLCSESKWMPRTAPSLVSFLSYDLPNSPGTPSPQLTSWRPAMTPSWLPEWAHKGSCSSHTCWEDSSRGHPDLRQALYEHRQGRWECNNRLTPGFQIYKHTVTLCISDGKLKKQSKMSSEKKVTKCKLLYKLKKKKKKSPLN